MGLFYELDVSLSLNAEEFKLYYQYTTLLVFSNSILY